LADDGEKNREFTRRFNKAAGSVISAICRDGDLKQTDTATLLGVSPRQVRRMERGQASYTLAQIELIARATQNAADEIVKSITNWPSLQKFPGRRKISR
jgi:transcriptional regulator with XRE-family HTH domain